MKRGIHPTYSNKAVIQCACGNVIKTGSTKEKQEIEICWHCHPFYTGKSKLIDAAGRVERFRERLKKRK
ncbi:MAG: 50S ribosomal protein L31 [Candidatus Sungbacteria bacterium]|nr:50S ribosomal protein L31 [Candidatus Sungbacteria bacterium]